MLRLPPGFTNHHHGHLHHCSGCRSCSLFLDEGCHRRRKRRRLCGDEGKRRLSPTGCGGGGGLCCAGGAAAVLKGKLDVYGAARRAVAKSNKEARSIARIFFRALATSIHKLQTLDNWFLKLLFISFMNFHSYMHINLWQLGKNPTTCKDV